MESVSLKRPQTGTRSLFVWIFVACFLCSLLVHLLFLDESRGWVLSGFSAANYDTIVPRTFRMKRVEIDPKTLSDVDPVLEKKSDHTPVMLSQDHPITDGKFENQEQLHVMQRPKEIVAEMGMDKIVGKLTETESFTSSMLSKSSSLPETLLETTTKGENPRLLPRKEEERKEISGTMEKSGLAGLARGNGTATNFSNIDELLAGTGTLSTKTAPILMPTDLLFEYDSDSLRKEAAQALSKLGDLIRKNGQASFRIEGHTDSFGSDNYNDQLSLRRAEAVKTWLIQNSGLDAYQITTAGLGKKHLLAPSSGSVAEQQLNRRVEIVITTD